ncbi:MAG: NUDIX domain-containing protein [archaeon]|nr:NUDIX domain-containing protein [archaeon]
MSALLVKDGKVLELHRPEKCRSFPGKWSFVSGKREKGESMEETARREVMEETKIEVSYPDETAEVFFVRENDTVFAVHTFLYNVGDVEPVLNEENTEYRWVPIDEISSEGMVDGVENAMKAFFRK